MTRTDLYRRILNAIDEYGDSYITNENGISISIKDGENNHYIVTVLPDIENQEITEEEKLAYTE